MLYMKHFFAELVVVYYRCSRTSTPMVHNYMFYIEIEHMALKPISVFTTLPLKCLFCCWFF
ncbi:unnamed protein product [Ixodes persulcatus]